MRTMPNLKSQPITEATYAELLAALDLVYPGKWRRAVDVCPVAVNKTIDNELDARETIRRILGRAEPDQKATDES